MNKKNLLLSILTLVTIILLAGSSLAVAPAIINPTVTQSSAATDSAANTITTTTPIKHLIVIFQENISFDHYFATYPYAKNSPGEPPFLVLPNTPSINGLSKTLLNNNTNLVIPFRMNKEDVKTVASCDNNHTYTAIQKSYNGGLMDKFVESSGIISDNCSPNQVMGYFDGNTVTAFWNYAQHFAMSDNFYSTVIGPSLPGHFNLISGQTHGVTPENIEKEVSKGTLIGDLDSLFDDCSNKTKITMEGKNIGNLLNENEIEWGWFSGGFKPSVIIEEGKAICESAHVNIAGNNITDYVVHHEPFQYYNSTANPHHLPPSSINMTGKTDQANHQYDLSDFWDAVESGNLPSVSFLKAPYYQTGHTKASDPIDEQTFLVNTINRLQKLPQWNSTAVIIAYDDTGGWYDHVMPPIISQSNDPAYDSLLGPERLCGNASSDAYQDRCGYGGRLPMLIISPWTKENYVDHQIMDQTSILRFIEDNWRLGRIGDQSFDEKASSISSMFNFTDGHHANNLFLDPSNGTVVSK
jgi:phospholipase C